MKLVIYAQDYNGKVAGTIFEVLREKEDIDSYENPLYLDGTLEMLDIPESVDSKYLDIVETESGFEVVENTLLKNQDLMNKELAKLKEEMDRELYDLMYQVSGTSDFNSATIFEKTWTKMVNNPSNYSGLGLTARFDRGDDGLGNPLSKGDALDSNDKVQSYAQACLDEVEAAEAVRMQRIEQYKQDVATVIASYSGSV